MRIACLYLPAFRLQVHVRSAPHLQGTAFCVVQTGRDVPRVTACSRKAREAGVRAGMTPTQARAVAPGVTMVNAVPAAYLQAAQALGEALLALSLTVDINELGCVYARVPPTTAGFGEKMLQAATGQGLIGRVGIADDRFTAWAATQIRPRLPVRTVPAGGSAKFLAVLGLELLPMNEDARRTLMLLGIRTIGDFATLPPPTVGRRWAQGGTDAQVLARGEDPTPLEAFLPSAPICEEVELESEVSELEPLSFVLRPLFERAVARLAGRGQAAARTAIRLTGGGQTTEVVVAPSQPTTSARTLIDLARAHLAEQKLGHAVARLSVVVLEETTALPQELELFSGASAPEPGAVNVAVARLRAAFGPEAAFATRLADRHRPEGAYERVPFAPPERAAASGPAGPRAPVRLLEPPAAAEAEADTLRIGGTPQRIVGTSGLTRLEGEWWTDEPLARDYYEVQTEDGARYWLYRDHSDGKIYLHGVFD